MYFILTLSLLSVCIFGDNFLLIINQDLKRALVDNCTHSLVAVISWLIVLLKCHLRPSLIINSVVELMLCGFIASVIDIDHFLMAKSYKLKNALHLGRRRPPLHCTTVPVVILVACHVAGWFLVSPRLLRIGWITWVSIFSHHIRDASRRGFWLWPFGSTPPIPYFLYIFLTLCLPYFVMIPLKTNIFNRTQLSSNEYIAV